MTQNDAQRYPKWSKTDPKTIQKWYCWTLELAQLGTENGKQRLGKTLELAPLGIACYY
jgi:hypothetical protein